MQQLNDTQIENLINCVKTHPILYERGQKGYKFVNIKKKIWSEISAVTNINDPSVCRKAWKSLRDQFIRSYRGSHRSGGTGLSGSEKKKYRYYEALLFLADTLEPNSASSNYDDSNSDDEATMKHVHLMEETVLQPLEEIGFECNPFPQNSPADDLATSSRKSRKRKNHEPITEDDDFKDFIETLVGKYLKDEDDTDRFFLHLSSLAKKCDLSVSEMVSLQCHMITELRTQLASYGKL